MASAVFSAGDRNRVATPVTVPIFLRFLFRDGSDPPVPVNVVGPVATVLREGVAQKLAALGSTAGPDLKYTLIAVAGSTGLYKLSFLTTGLSAGLYRVLAEGSWTDPFSVVQTLQVEGEFALGEVARLDSLIARVETSLMDDVDPRLYRLDEPIPQWTADQIYLHMLAALDTMNSFPPRLTSFDFDTVPFDQMLVDGARVYALYARARFEKANELTYSDVHNLDIKRADFYKSLADTLYAQWAASVTSYKRMTPPTPIGLKGQQLPFRVSRVLGLLPNFKTLFSG